MGIESNYYLDLREKPIGQALGQNQRVEVCPCCGKGAVLFKRLTAKNGSRTETWHHEIRLRLDGKNNPVREQLVERCKVQVSALDAKRQDEARE